MAVTRISSSSTVSLTVVPERPRGMGRFEALLFRASKHPIPGHTGGPGQIHSAESLASRARRNVGLSASVGHMA
jgi:hypothetical protein